jgi:ABC-type branched-subunit amino acid transport system substrate-binding protein
MPFIAPFTGAAFLRNPELTNVFNVRASYNAETEMWIRHLVDEQGLTKIAILYQDDGFGRAGLSGTVAALERRGMTLVAEGTFARNTTAVRTALLDLRRAEPEAVVMVGPYLPMAEFIRTARQVSFEAEFVNISFVGTDALVGELGADGAGVIISQVVPYPTDTSIPVVARYTEALAAVDPQARPGFISLEGYLAGRLAIAALEAAGPQVTRAGYLAALQGLTTLDVDGLPMTFGPGDNQALDDVFLTVISPAGEISQMGTGG